MGSVLFKEYYLRGIPKDLWLDARVLSIKKGVSLAQVLIRLLALWVSGKIEV